MILCSVCGYEVFRSIDEHILQRHPIIKIDDHSFQLIYKNLTDSYLVIKIKNIRLKFSFFVYRSNSHGGIFRLCTRTDETSDHLYKGDTDYVTQTFIHIELQKFIIQNYANLLTDDTLTIRSCPSIRSRLIPDDLSSLYYHDMINNQYYNRRYINEKLHRLVNINCGTAFLSVEELIENITRMYDLPGNYSLLQKPIMSIINPAFDVSTLSRRPSANLLLPEYRRVKPDIKTKKKIIRLYLEYISEYLNERFKLLPATNKSLYSDTFTIPRIEGVTIEMTYYSVEMQKRIPSEDNNFLVIYALYNIRSSIHTELNGRYSKVFNIIPMTNHLLAGSSLLNNNNINRVGLYRYYMSIGIYLCKIFEYITQARDIAGKSYGDYTFVGDLYTNLFPVNKLYESI
jgi:hypothetical protein